ncbi:hypothetical protein B0P06_003735 [Clostridium saccharoperbutylacetonicum]|uniref:Uncharacterized protein n=1 Tax=Clostridium saccharoperbutylacetonicum N1-4(HMT) TaxID=931276 RepID=M1LXG2_9CLOT|nr:hypothetical protein [Clostridium saccharoperbutylacetonicum]AGF57955.1 hypothetical protein Cspa_c42020 [Clostridium saccharoperbutylacetonicum N1-4(HMT)]NRT61272.1 hypothetical protein [Clostridium saccharoperbutylacetonicum]NSB24589.1 hypothetical protein [Clostridium saccharoperbutylacetonicum]NSB43964.1 hypothetical protein [Clostridium saccharoperbutylacetonicum]
MDYIAYSIFSAVIIINLIIFIYRKNKVGNILMSIGTSKGSFISGMIFGIIFLLLEGYFIYLEKFIDHQPIRIANHSLMFIGIIMILNAITSTTFIGEKGVSFMTIPFFISLNKISGYKIEDNKFVLNRVNKADYSIPINISDSGKITKVINELKNRGY